MSVTEVLWMATTGTLLTNFLQIFQSNEYSLIEPEKYLKLKTKSGNIKSQTNAMYSCTKFKCAQLEFGGRQVFLQYENCWKF